MEVLDFSGAALVYGLVVVDPAVGEEAFGQGRTASAHQVLCHTVAHNVEPCDHEALLVIASPAFLEQ